MHLSSDPRGEKPSAIQGVSPLLGSAKADHQPRGRYIQTLEKRLAKTESLLSAVSSRALGTSIRTDLYFQILPGIDLSNIDDVLPPPSPTPIVNGMNTSQPLLTTGQLVQVSSEGDTTSDDERTIIPLTRAPPMAPLLQVFWGALLVVRYGVPLISS